MAAQNNKEPVSGDAVIWLNKIIKSQCLEMQFVGCTIIKETMSRDAVCWLNKIKETMSRDAVSWLHKSKETVSGVPVGWNVPEHFYEYKLSKGK